jgi:hypothetical protein
MQSTAGNFMGGATLPQARHCTPLKLAKCERRLRADFFCMAHSCE